MTLYDGFGQAIPESASLYDGWGRAAEAASLYDGFGNPVFAENTFLTPELAAAVDAAETTVRGYSGTKFAYLTDLHLSGDGQLMQGKNTVCPFWSAAVVSEICRRGLVEAVVIGGDLINAYAQINDTVYASTLEDAVSRIQTALSAIDTHGLPLFVVKGNHDLNSKYDADITSDTSYPNKVNDAVWQSLTEPYAAGAVYNEADKAGYFYADLSGNVRLCVWNQYTGDCVDSSGNDGNGTSNAECAWMRDTAYQDGKTIVTVYHNPESFATYQGMYTRFFVDGGSYDGRTWAGGQKAIVVNSHNHADNLSHLYDGTMQQNVPQFNVRNAFAVTHSTASNVSVDEGNDRACVSIFTVDVENQHVYETRIGKGESRESAFCTVAAADMLRQSIASDGSPYNGGTGYKSGYRLNSGGNESAASGVYCSGFIPMTNAQTIEFEGIELPAADSVANSYYTIHFYDSAFTRIVMSQYQAHNVFMTPSIGSGTKDDSGNYIKTFKPTGVSGLAYIRFSCGLIDDNSKVYVYDN